MTNRIDHTSHNHPATTAARQACRKLVAGVKVADMIQAHVTPEAVAWGVVLHINYVTGELKTRFSNLNDMVLYIPASEVIAVEHRPTPTITVIPSSECDIRAPHCEMCGTINPDDEDDYTTCCNEPVVYGPCGHDHS